MTADPLVVPGLLLLALELLALASVGYLVARVALRQRAEGMALAQGLVIGPALWGLIVSFVLHLLPGMAGALAGWIIVVALGAGLAWRAPQALRVPLRSIAGFGLAGAAIFWVALAGRQLLTIPDPEIHLELAAAIRAGAWPPSPCRGIPWLPVYLPLRGGPADWAAGPAFWTGPGSSNRDWWAPTPGPALVLVVATLLWRRRLDQLARADPAAADGRRLGRLSATSRRTSCRCPSRPVSRRRGCATSLADIYWPAIKTGSNCP